MQSTLYSGDRRSKEVRGAGFSDVQEECGKEGNLGSAMHYYSGTKPSPLAEKATCKRLNRVADINATTFKNCYRYE